jgi:hypothetical protein
MVGRAKTRARKTVEDIIVQGYFNGMGIECSSKQEIELVE